MTDAEIEQRLKEQPEWGWVFLSFLNGLVSELWVPAQTDPGVRRVDIYDEEAGIENPQGAHTLPL